MSSSESVQLKESTKATPSGKDINRITFNNQGAAVVAEYVAGGVTSITNFYNSSPASFPLEPFKNVEILFNLKPPVVSFTGRLKQLHELVQALQCAPKETKPITAVIIGLGGVGKTELARKYASDHCNFYRHIVWIDAETPESMRGVFEQLANHYLGIAVTGRDNDVSVTISKVYQRMSGSKSLFIFDNAEGYATIQSFLPPMLKKNAENVSVLFTSRCRDWDVADEGAITEIHVKEFMCEEAEEFVNKSLNDKNVSDENVRRLTKELQYFPLALKQATAYINQQDHKNKRGTKKKFDIDDYLLQFRDHVQKFLDHSGRSGYDRYTKTVFAVLTVTFENLSTEENGENALDVLNIIAYLHPDFIKVDAFETFDDAVVLLEKYAIITVQIKTGYVDVHRLIQQVARLLNETNEVVYLRKCLIHLITSPVDAYTTFNATSAWSYAIKHFELIEDFYFIPELGYGEFMPFPPLDLFILFGYYEAAENLLKTVDSNPSMKSRVLHRINAQNRTPLEMALASGKKYFAQLLYSSGASIDIDANYYIERALSSRNWDIVSVLMEKISDVNAVADHKGMSLLNCAICDNELNIVKLLIARGADITAIAFNYAHNWDKRLRNAIDGNDLGLLKVYEDIAVLTAKANKGGNGDGPQVDDVDRRQDRCMTPLHFAVYRNNTEMVNILLEASADPNALDYPHESLLQYAVFTDKIDVASFLIKVSADVNSTHHRHETLLHYAILSNYLEIAKLLIECGADVNAICYRDETLLRYAVRENKTNIAELLVENGAKVESNGAPQGGLTPLDCAYIMDNADIVKLLNQKGAVVGASDTATVENDEMIALLQNDLAGSSDNRNFVLRICKCFCCKHSSGNDLDEGSINQ